ncbi:hypothetical protein Q7C36_004660 [Tachysurus vachellii]|uniref:Uncharacterized protein n=1 Tax=Tachysurus vachellii TaxID=175792 RepID=A0AA88TBB9_TACVA|nr:hypothetical protein Q7C36_004660 [Tachysurus vachellii]
MAQRSNSEVVTFTTALEHIHSQAGLVYLLIKPHNVEVSVLMKAEECRKMGRKMETPERVAENKSPYHIENCVFCKRHTTKVIGNSEKAVRFKAHWEDDDKGVGDCAISKLTSCGGCRVMYPKVILIEMEEIIPCFCLKCIKCKDYYGLKSRGCGCSWDGRSLESCTICVKMHDCGWLKQRSFRPMFSVGKTEGCLGLITQMDIKGFLAMTAGDL